MNTQMIQPVKTMTGAPKEHQRSTIASRWLRYAALLAVAMMGCMGARAADYVLKSLA